MTVVQNLLMFVVFVESDMMKNWPVKIVWKESHGHEQDRQQLLVPSKMEKQSKLHGNKKMCLYLKDWTENSGNNWNHH